MTNNIEHELFLRRVGIEGQTAILDYLRAKLNRDDLVLNAEGWLDGIPSTFMWDFYPGSNSVGGRLVRIINNMFSADFTTTEEQELNRLAEDNLVSVRRDPKSGTDLVYGPNRTTPNSLAITKVNQPLKQPRIVKPKYFDLNELKTYCHAPMDWYHQFGEVHHTPHGIYIYKDNGAKILAVAHLDTVENADTFRVEEEKVYLVQLDDREGAYMILDLLPKYLPEKVNYDILLTEGEESGRSTAQFFEPPEGKEYNWMFEIDRSGTDAVTYQYQDPEWKKAIESVGYKTSHGSFTDISMLGSLGVCGVNFACGYYNNHSPNSWMDLEEAEESFERIVAFMKKYYDQKFEHDPSTSYGRRYHYSAYGGGYYDYWDGEDDWYSRTSRTSYRSTNTRKDDAYSYASISTIVKCKDCGTDNFKNDMVCIYCGETLEESISESCEVCKSSMCRGMVECTICTFTFHDDIWTNEFGMCRDCMSMIYDIPEDLLDKVEFADILDSDSTEALGDVYKFIGELQEEYTEGEIITDSEVI